MPIRNLYLRGSNGSLEQLTPRGLADPDSNVFDKAFSTDPTNDPVDMEDWNDWMKWESGIDAPILDRKHSNESTASSQGNWFSDIESSGKDAASGPLTADNDFSFEDAPFEFDDTMTSPHMGPGNEAPIFEADRERTYRRYSTLTPAEEKSLQNIAMPYLLSKVKISSVPSSPILSQQSSISPTPSPEPEPEVRTRKTKKRRANIDDEDVPSALCQSRKRGHNAIEKRYRTNLNDKINCLRQGVPSLCGTSHSADEADDSDAEGVDSKIGQQKYGKAAILTRALEYIQHLESTSQRLGGEVTTLKIRVGAFEKLAMSGSMIINSAGTPLNEPPVVKSETLQSIKADFKQIKPKTKPTSTKSAATRRGSSRSTKKC